MCWVLSVHGHHGCTRRILCRRVRGLEVIWRVGIVCWRGVCRLRIRLERLRVDSSLGYVGERGAYGGVSLVGLMATVALVVVVMRRRSAIHVLGELMMERLLFRRDGARKIHGGSRIFDSRHRNRLLRTRLMHLNARLAVFAVRGTLRRLSKSRRPVEGWRSTKHGRSAIRRGSAIGRRAGRGHWPLERNGRNGIGMRANRKSHDGTSRHDGAHGRGHAISSNGGSPAHGDAGGVHAAVVYAGSSTGEPSNRSEASASAPAHSVLIGPEVSRYENKRPLDGGEDVPRRAVGKRNSNRLVAPQRRPVIWQFGVLLHQHIGEADGTLHPRQGYPDLDFSY
jgi:hypothetical protein